MMQFFKKTITLKINIFALCLVLVLFLGLLAVIRFHVPENLFFMLLRPSHVESAELRLSSQQGYTQLTDQEIADTIAILNTVRVTDEVERCLSPSSLAVSDCKIHLKWGITLYTNTNIGGLGINAYKLPGNPEQEKSLWLLWREIRQARTEP